MKQLLSATVTLLLFSGCHNYNSNDESAAMPATMNYTVVNVYPHDTTSFTEGLEWHDSLLYESTGNYGPSKLLKANLKTGKAVQSIALSKDYFGEGISILNGKIYQMTYKEHKCFVYDSATFKKLNEFTYDGEGWGMTNNGKQIIMDNGNNYLYFRDPATFKVTDSIGVFDNNGPVAAINELEWVDGVVYANIWQTNYIIKIDPKTGKVLARADLSTILQNTKVALPERMDVLNGIAYNKATKHFYITGKLWPTVFEVAFN